MASHQAVISWTAPTTGDAVVNYVVQRAQVIGGVVGAFVTIASPTTTTYTDTTVVGGNDYEFQVASQNAGGESTFITSAVELIPLAAPQPPTNLLVSVS